MNEMIERVAACIKGGSVFSQEDRLDMARAAIEAMREPTQAMLYASPIWNDDARRYHTIMIDAALKEPTHD